MDRENIFKKISKNDYAILALIALIKLLIHFIVNLSGGYGYFRDEFYYLACGEHLAFGYVDHPLMIALIAKTGRILFGDSIFAIRILPALASAATVFLTGVIVKEMGGKRSAQILASVAAFVAPIFLITGSFLSMNPFDHMFWALACLMTIKIINDPRNFRYWLYLGLIVGLGLENKISLLFWGLGFLVGVLLTKNRKFFRSWGIWVAGSIIFLLFLPYLIWQVEYNYPTLEFMRNASMYKNVHFTPVEFMKEHMLQAHPLAFILVLIAIYLFFFNREGIKYRLFGWMYVSILIFLVITHAKPYYSAPILPLMFAGGAIGFISLLAIIHKKAIAGIIFSLYLILLILSGIVLAPLTLPVLPIEKYIDYQKALGIPSNVGENHEMGILPQMYADMFGWEEMVSEVAKVYHGLPLEEQEKCVIFGSNYGEAGAIDFFSDKYKLPGAISNHNNYWIWGPGQDSIGVLIVIGIEENELKEVFREVEQAGIFRNKYVMPYENNLPIFICRNAIIPLGEIWKNIKSFG